MSEEIIHELLGYDRIKIYQRPDAFSFSLDSMLLADFIKPTHKTKKIIELGCGNAPILLFLTMKTKASLYGIELQKEIYELAEKSVEINSFQKQITLINDDIKDIYKKVGANQFDIVYSNPPFFKYLPTSNINKNELLTIARHEYKIDLQSIIIEAKKLLIDSGTFYLVHRVNRLTECIQILKEQNFGIKTIRMVYTKTSSDKALLFLLEAKLNRPDDVVVTTPLYVYDGDNYTDEILQIFNFQKNKED